jgi:hypothetical protein
MILFTTYYKSQNEERQKEINLCLLKNVENKYIEKIILLNNKIFVLPIQSEKIEQVVINKNRDYILKFCDAVHYMNTNYVGKICILANSDIYFDETLEKITDNAIYENKNDNEPTKNVFFALNKYNLLDNNLIFDERNNSQDSWIFKSPLDVDYKYINYTLGTMGCDGNFAYRVNLNKYLVSNPSLDIITTHVHQSNFRTYKIDNFIKGIYLSLDPTTLDRVSEKKFIVA